MSSICDHNFSTFLSTNFPLNYNYGLLNLPSSMLGKYGSLIPRRVFLQLPNRSLWSGVYIKGRNCIEGLKSMFHYYRIKPYHMFVLFYNGGHILGLEIFNMYGVEIDYTSKQGDFGFNDSINVEAVWLNDCYYLSSDIEMDKLSAQFNYNCKIKKSQECDLVITKQHLEPKIYNQILSEKTCHDLGLDDSICSLEIGFAKLFYKVDMHWINGQVYLNKIWCDFAKEGKLREGDICVLQKNVVENKIEVAVFEKSNLRNFNISGVTQGKSVMKWLKVINSEITRTYKLALPRIFAEEYGILLIDNVHLIMPDGEEFCVQFSEEENELSGLQEMMSKYSISIDYVLFFDFVGRSHFVVTVFNAKGDDLFASSNNKVLLKNVMRETKCPFDQKNRNNATGCQPKAYT